MRNVIKYRIKALAMLFMVAGLVGYVSSCKEEEEPSGDVALLSFGPAGVHHGD
jgi:hypothetical protein